MDHRTELVDVIRRVRNRWRLKLAMRGAVVVVAGTVLALLLSASGLESFRFTAPAIIAFRVVTVGVFVGLLLYGLVWPLRRRVTDAQVARGADQAGSAKLIGFSSSDVTVMMRGAQNAAYERVPLIPGKEQGTFEGMLFHLEKPTEYYVESNGVRSAKFTLSVVDL